MPTYQYSCTECGHSFEQFQSFSDEALTVCPECAGRLRKVYDAVGVVFKGSGFYRTDSRKAETAAAGSGDGGSKDSGSSKPESGGQSDTKSGGSSSGKSDSGGASGAAKASQGSAA